MPMAKECHGWGRNGRKKKCKVKIPEKPPLNLRKKLGENMVSFLGNFILEHWNLIYFRHTHTISQPANQTSQAMATTKLSGRTN